MDWNKFFNIAIIALLITIGLQLFMGPPPSSQTTMTGGVSLQIASQTTTIPNLPQISIINQTASGVMIDTCQDITFFYNSNPVNDIPQVAPDFCQQLEIGAGATKPIPLESLSESIFSKHMGSFIVKAQIEGVEKMVTFTHEPKGAFTGFFYTTIYEPIYNLLVGIISTLPGHSLGWAIIIVTIIIRLILLVPQHHMLVNQRKLQLIQPKIKELQEKHKGDSAKLGQEMLALYSREKVSPMGSCLPLLIQMPIMIGLYWVISTIDHSSNYYYLYSFFKGFDIAQINAFFYGLDLTQIGGIAGVIFGLILAGVQWLQAKLSFSYQESTPTKSSKTPKIIEKNEKGEYEAPKTPEMFDPELMKKMMLYVFPVMIGVSALFFPLGVALYWLIGTIFVIAQQWVVNQMESLKK